MVDEEFTMLFLLKCLNCQKKKENFLTNIGKTDRIKMWLILQTT